MCLYVCYPYPCISFPVSLNLGAKINTAFCLPNNPSDRGNDLTKMLCDSKGLRGVIIEPHPYTCEADPDLAEVSRLYHCHAYNALAEVLIATQKEERFFSGFLFKEPKADTVILDHMLDLNRSLFLFIVSVAVVFLFLLFVFIIIIIILPLSLSSSSFFVSVFSFSI